MKKLLLTIIAFTLTMVSFSQSFEKGKMYNSFSLGYQGYIPVGAGGGFGLARFSRGLTIQYQAEWGIHDYVGLGFHTGATLNFRLLGSGLITYIPIGVQSNFHFYQLIADKTGGNLHADKLDIYAGLSFGGGPVIYSDDFGSSINGALHIGPQVGIKYYPTERLGVFAEFGYGRSLAMFGIVIK